LGVLFATALPSFLVGTFRANGMVPENAWFYTAVILGVVIVLNILVTWYSTKGKEIFEVTGNKVTLKNILAEIRDIFRLRVYTIIIAALFIYYVGHTILIGNIIFFATYILNITEDTLSLIYLIIVGSGMLYALLLGTVAVKFDKRNVFIACMLFSSLALIMAKFIGLSTFLHLAILAALATVGVAAFATLSYVLVFDVIEVDEFKSGKRREGVIFAYQSLVKKVGAAGAAWAAGALLQFSGFEREAVVQSEQTLATIESLATLYPGILMGLCGLALFFFPITKKRHSALMKALALKKQGLEYSTEEFDILLK
jgi:Na+/melibiose symporter-like transporter